MVPPVATQSTPTAAPAVVIDQTFLEEEVAKSWKPDLSGAVMVVVHESAGGRASGSAGTDPTGATPSADDLIRIGSITKTFTSIAVLWLAGEGLVDLDQAAVDCVSRLDLDPGITVRDLLRHSSGSLARSG